MKETYTRMVKNLMENNSLDEAMSLAVGGWFDSFGSIQVNILRHFGLQPHYYLIDVGCGSGRLAKPLSECHSGKYSGFDIVNELVDYAANLVQRPDWRFEAVDGISIPEDDHCADMICFFSVFTHLLHEQSYWYLEESIRVLKPGSKIIFSFLEFREPKHWPIFRGTLYNTKMSMDLHIDVFINRDDIRVWADHLGCKVEAFFDAFDSFFGGGAPLGQAVCVLSTPLTPPTVSAMRLFYNKYKKIYIYGAGKYGESLIAIMRMKKMTIEGFIVSDGQPKTNHLFGYKIFNLSEIPEPSDELGIILAIDKRYRGEVLPLLQKKGYNTYSGNTEF